MSGNDMKGSIFSGDTKFARFMNKLFDVLYTGLLWFGFSIPIITIGAAMSAGYYTMVKCVRHRTGYIFREFWGCFKRNFKQSLPMTIFFLLAAAVIAVDIRYLWMNENKANDSMFIVMLLVAFVLLGVLTYVFPLLSRFDQRNMQLLKMAFLEMFRHLPLTIGLLLLDVAAVVVVYVMPWTIFIIPGAYLFVFSFPVEKILRKLMPPVEEGSEEAEKWYYQ
ncbi:MAG: YesL family protein [Clostridiales bacterium]|nr:YesL family protein [Clostridiales bacterium]